MAEATDQQMQIYADQRIRPFAEAMRAVILGEDDDKLAIDDVYARASGTNPWSDNRTDGPPHLLQAGNGANPDDFLNFNAFISALSGIIEAADSTNDAANAAALRSAWPVLRRACVRNP